jgi:hypothetical protein
MTASSAKPRSAGDARSDLATRIQSALNLAAGELQLAGEAERVTQLNEELARPRRTKPIVVVSGEEKVGKSSLVNALLRRPRLSPVAADIATGARIVFQHASADAAAVHLVGADSLQPIPVAEIHEWASTEANPGNEKGVKSVAVAIDARMLIGLTLVDTPGVGGLEAGHGQAALESLRHADVLMLVSDAGSHLTAPELRFLVAAAERIDTVILVLTKSDLASDLGAVRSRNAELLAEHAPRFADVPMIAISSARAERALAKGEEPDERSGFPKLEHLLEELVGRRAGVLRLANAVRFADSSLRELERRWRERVAAASGNQEFGAALEREQARLAELQRERASWTTTLEEELADLGWARANDLVTGISAIRNRYDELSKQASHDHLAALPGQLIEEVEALANRLAAASNERAERLVAEIGAEIDPGSALASTLRELSQIRIDEDTQLTAPTTRQASELDRLTTLVSFSSGHSIGQFVLSAGVFGLLGAPLAIGGAGVGAVFAWKMSKGRQQLNLQADFRIWQQQQLALAQNLISNEFNRRTGKLRGELRAAANLHLKRREDEIAAAIKLNEQARASDAQERQRSLAQATARLEGARSALTQIETALADLREIRG